MLDSLHSLLAFAVIALVAWGLGAPIVNRFRAANEDRLSRLVWSFALGMVVAGLLLTLLGFCGLFSPRMLRMVTLIGCGWAVGQLLSAWITVANHPERELSGRPSRSRRFDSQAAFDATTDVSAQKSVLSDVPSPNPLWQAGLYVACLLALTGSLVSALAPATAGDALCYHLELPKRFLAEGAITFIPWHDNATFPLLTEMWFAWAMALEGAVTAQLVQWGMGILFAAAVTCLARELIGKDWAWTAGTLALVIPGVTTQMTAPLNDLALAAFATLALLAWKKVFSNVEVATTSGVRWLWLLRGGAALGAALAIKYVALLLLAAVGIVTAWRVVLRRAPLRSAAISTGCVLGVAIIVAAPWYVRAVWHRGNPVYPFFASLAGDDRAPETIRDSKRPLDWRPRDLAAAPWRLTMAPEEFGGRGHQLGCLLLAAVPGIVFVRRLAGLRDLLLFSAVYFVLWFALRQNLRFLLPAIGPSIIAATWVIAEMARFPAVPRRISHAAIVGAIALSAIIPLHRARPHVVVALGMESRAEYLAREEPTYTVANFAARYLPADARILSQEYRLFYFRQSVTRENIWRRETGYHQHATPAQAMAHIKTAGFTHVLLAEATHGDLHYNATLNRLVAAAETTNPNVVEAAFESEFIAPDGQTRTYRLLKLR